jgi:hypothetical protein
MGQPLTEVTWFTLQAHPAHLVEVFFTPELISALSIALWHHSTDYKANQQTSFQLLMDCDMKTTSASEALSGSPCRIKQPMETKPLTFCVVRWRFDAFS